MMQYLVDTGVLLRLFDRSDSEHSTIRTLLSLLRKEEQHSLFTSPQNIAEFWNVSTRPASARGGFGQSVSSTNRRVVFLEALGVILPDHPATYQEWRKLVVQHQVKGVAVHDARIVALMRVFSIATVITLNPRDFERYPDVTALTPLEVSHSLSESP